MTPAQAKEFFQFVTRTLPNLLGELSDPLDALQALGEKWKETRTHNIEDRSAEVAEDRAQVDKRLAERRKKRRKPAQNPEE